MGREHSFMHQYHLGKCNITGLVECHIQKLRGYQVTAELVSRSARTCECFRLDFYIETAA
jgi:hypothetical protein